MVPAPPSPPGHTAQKAVDVYGRDDRTARSAAEIYHNLFDVCCSSPCPRRGPLPLEPVCRPKSSSKISPPGGWGGEPIQWERRRGCRPGNAGIVDESTIHPRSMSESARQPAPSERCDRASRAQEAISQSGFPWKCLWSPELQKLFLSKGFKWTSDSKCLWASRAPESNFKHGF